MIMIQEDTRKRWENLLPVVFRVGLNSGLITSQNLDGTDVGIIFNLHGQKLYLFKEATEFLKEKADLGQLTDEDLETIDNFNQKLQALEFAAQEAWGFDEDANYHNWWMDMPGCKCPQMDNRERQGIEGYIHNGGCPWHGQFDYTKTQKI